MTSYIVLKRIATGTASATSSSQSGNGTVEWREVGQPVEATSADAAIRKAVTEAGNYTAIPVRSFKSVKVTVETPAPVVKIA